jgi:hypothetical protein
MQDLAGGFKKRYGIRPNRLKAQFGFENLKVVWFGAKQPAHKLLWELLNQVFESIVVSHVSIQKLDCVDAAVQELGLHRLKLKIDRQLSVELDEP